MSRFTLSPRAQADVDEIWDYIVKHWGVEQAEFYAETTRG
ncbi:MAG: type II toxin-antitoxin system RelE/ParE family toxin [Methylocella sp.]